MSCVGRACNNATTSAVSVMPVRERLCAAELIIQSYLPLLVSQTPSLGSDTSPCTTGVAEAVVVPMKTAYMPSK